MRAILQTTQGGADTLYLADAPTPMPSAGQLGVRVRAAGVNRADIVQREGRYPPPVGASPILGLELAGVVEAVGEGCTRFAVGDAVLALVSGGGYADYALVNEAEAIAKPDALSWAVAASLPEAWLTAWLNLVEVGGLVAGQRVLIHAGASGVGAAAIQLAVWRGAEVIATCSGAEKAAFCRALGAQHVIDYQTEDVAKTVRGLGAVHLVLDCIGGETLNANLSTLAQDGKLVLIGIMGGAQAAVNLGLVLVKRLSIVGSTLRSQPLAVRAQLARQLETQVLPALLAGTLQPTLDRCFPLAEVAAAHAWLEARANKGKVVLVVD